MFVLSPRHYERYNYVISLNKTLLVCLSLPVENGKKRCKVHLLNDHSTKRK